MVDLEFGPDLIKAPFIVLFAYSEAKRMLFLKIMAQLLSLDCLSFQLQFFHSVNFRLSLYLRLAAKTT